MTGPRDTTTTVLIGLAPDAARLSGFVRVDDGPKTRFSGWLELMRELEQAHTGANADPVAAPPDARADTTTLTVTYRLAGGSLTGEVGAPEEPSRPFLGWHGLLSALEAAVGREASGP